MPHRRPTSLVVSRARLAVALAMVVGGACNEPTGVSISGRAVLVALDVPAELAAGAPLSVGLQFELGYCERVTALRSRVIGSSVEIEVRNVYELAPGIGGCIDIGPAILDTTVVVTGLPTGPVLVRGLQPGNGPSLDAVVLVLPE